MVAEKPELEAWGLYGVQAPPGLVQVVLHTNEKIVFSLPCVPSFDKKWKVTKFCLYVDQTQLSVYMLNINCLLTSIHDQDGEMAMGINKLITSGKIL